MCPTSVAGLDDHARPGAGGGVAVDDADLVVDEVDVVQGGIERPERLASAVERVDRAVAVRGDVQDLAVDLDLDAGLRPRLGPVAALDDHGEVDDPERRRVAPRAGDGRGARRTHRLPRSWRLRPRAASPGESSAGSSPSAMSWSSCRTRQAVLALPPSSLTTTRITLPTFRARCAGTSRRVGAWRPRECRPCARRRCVPRRPCARRAYVGHVGHEQRQLRHFRQLSWLKRAVAELQLQVRAR